MIRTWIKDFLERLIASNKKEFGNKRLDCCEIKKMQIRKSRLVK
ncbi:MAG TPA: LDCC motif putative metal-binding protein [Tissierellaceae bacterium]|nr:LDCC motif putative metal-binding protein [Tissierellaceae bacterium]